MKQTKIKRKYSQKMYLFAVYGSLILLLLSIFFIFTYSHYRRNTYSEVKKDTKNLCASINNAIDTQLETISNISLNIVYSNAIKKNFSEFSKLDKSGNISTKELVSSREKALYLHDTITAIIGASQSASQVNLYTMDGYCVEAGMLPSTTPIRKDVQDMPWYDSTASLNGHKYITKPMINKELPAEGENQNTHKFISLTRLFFKGNNEPEGVVEVIQDCNKIFSLATQLEASNPAMNVYIYNDRQELVYPYQRPVTHNFYNMIDKNQLSAQTAKMVTGPEGETLLFTYETTENYNWTVIVTQPKSAIYASLSSFRTTFLIIVLFSILFTLIICFYISERLTSPLQKLTAATEKITINQVLDEEKVDLSSANSTVEEIATLCQSIDTMYDRLKTTSQEVILSRSEETMAKLQATQSLINPHFLYNCLTNISIMAEEEMNDDIIHLCDALSDYFRYISSSGDMIVPISEEVLYTERYLECMKLRYTEELMYAIHVDNKTSDILIPKLILQPIVENVFKHAFNKTPPWKLSITSRIEYDHWIIEISDNGGMLSETTKQELLENYKNLNIDQELKSLKIGGMGIKNVYLRLKLLYGKQAIFKIETIRSLKTTFIIGGPIQYQKEDSHGQDAKL